MTATALPTGERFLRSALTEEGKFLSTAEALNWIEQTKKRLRFVVRQIAFGELGEWSMDAATGDLVHESGKFFRVEGIRARTDLGPLDAWEQPIINQPEIGILGIVAREFDGVLHFLMQAKMEPGNLFGVQLSPTVQATRSNYTQVHQGSRPAYLDYFLDRSLATVLVDQLQWEQGTVFLRKRNRNIVVEVTEDIPVEEDFRWLTLGQIRALLGHPNLTNMETRTVVACMALTPVSRADARPTNVLANGFGAGLLASLSARTSALSDDTLESWLTDLKCRHQLATEHLHLDHLDGWTNDGREIARADGRFFRVMAVEVETDSREVVRWSQPLIGSVETGLIAILASSINGVLHFLVQARVEPGSADTVTVCPTIQCALGGETRSASAATDPLFPVLDRADAADIRYSALQSEEGGRFYRVVNEYRVVEIEGGARLSLPPNYAWVTLRQLQELLRYGLVSVEARSLLSCLSFT